MQNKYQVTLRQTGYPKTLETFYNQTPTQIAKLMVKRSSWDVSIIRHDESGSLIVEIESETKGMVIREMFDQQFRESAVINYNHAKLNFFTTEGFELATEITKVMIRVWGKPKQRLYNILGKP